MEIWSNWLGDSLLRRVGLVALLVAAVYILRYLLVLVVGKWLGPRGLLPKGLALKRHFFPSLHILMFAMLFGIVLPLFNFPEHTERVLERVTQMATALGTTWFLLRLAKLLELITYEIYSNSGLDNLRQRRARTQVQFIYRIVALLIGVLGVGTILLSFQSARQFGASILASAGLASLVVGFSAQKSLANLIAGFQIAFTQPIRIDDIVIVEKEWGRVEEITLTYVVVRLWDLRRMILPITYFIEKPFENWTRQSHDLLGYFFLYVDYHLPVEEVRQEFQRMLAESKLWDGKTSSLLVTNSTDKCIELRVLFGTRSAPDAFDLKCEIRERLLTLIQQRYPQCLPRVRSESVASGTVKSVDGPAQSFLT